MPPAALRLPVPSPRLLRFLRSQSDSLLYSLHPGPGVWPGSAVGATPGTPRTIASCRQRCVSRRSPPRTLSRQFCTASRPPPCTVRLGSSLEAALFDVDKLLPKSLRKKKSSGDGKGARDNRDDDGSVLLEQEEQSDPEDPRASEDSEIKEQQEQQKQESPRRRPGARRWKLTWQERLWGNSRESEGMCGDESPDSNFTFSSRRSQLMRAPMDPRLRCTEVDENGEVILVDGEYKKSELIAKYGLLPRDLRKIDSSNLPHILVRPSAILLNLLHLRVLIKSDRVLLFDVYGSKSSYNQSAFMYDLQGRLQQKQSQPGLGGLPYEFRALEAVLISVTTALEADLYTVREPVVRILRELEDDINRDRLRILLVLSKKVSTFEQKAKLVRDAIDELLEADDDLAAMYLTEKRHDLFRGEDDHTEVEMLLESYHKVCDEVVQEAGSLVSSIRNTEEIIRAILDANRNSLMLLELKFSIGALGVAMGTFLAGLYGMNLENFIEETNWGFAGVTGASVFFSLVVCWYGLAKLRKVQRVKMHGNEARAHLGESPWFRDEMMGGLLEDRPGERLRRMRSLKQASKVKKWL